MHQRKAKSLFTGKVTSSYIHNPREVHEIQNTDTRFFRRLLKKQGKQSLDALIQKNSVYRTINLVIK